MFEELKAIPASEVALQAGLHLQRRGSRQWTRCPLHGEKTPSMCFYEDGGWHCFGCGEGGDAVALYAALHSTSMGEAARVLAGEHGVEAAKKPRGPTAGDLRRAVTAWFNRQWAEACSVAHATYEALAGFTDKDRAWDDPRFVAALQAHTEANTRMDRLNSLDDEGRIKRYLEEVKMRAAS